MMIRSMDTGYGSIQYAAYESYIMLTEYKGRDISLNIPESIGGKPITAIGKKSFLGAGQLRELRLPACIEEIGDWAFACCGSLESLVLHKKELALGQGILKNCPLLERVIVMENNSAGVEAQDDRGISYLLAAVVNKLEAPYLFDTRLAGSVDWLAQWDDRMLTLMEQEDAEGFSKMLLCGEEDYGSRENDFDYYIEQRRKFKSRLAMLRLMHDTGLAEPLKDKLISYLKAHTKGTDSEEAWKVVLEEHGDDGRYYRFLLDIRCIDGDNIDGILSDMGERHAEMKAFLLNWQGRIRKAESVFDALAW